MGQIPQYYSRELPNVAPPKAPLISNQAASKVVDLVDHYERRKTEDDVAGALAADKTFQEKTGDPLAGVNGGPVPEGSFQLLDQGNPAGAYQRYQDAAEQTLLELSNGLENDEQRALLTERAREHMRITGDRVAKWEAEETERQRRLSFGTHAETETQRAAQLTLQGKDEEAAKALHMSMALLNQTLPHRTQAERDAARLALTSGYHGTVFRGKLAGDPADASAYLREHKDQMAPEVYAGLQAAGDHALDKKASLDLVLSVYDRDSSKSAILQQIEDSDASDRQKDIARQWADDQWEIDQARKKAAKQEQTRAAEEAVQAALKLYGEGVSFPELPDTVLNAMTPAGRKAARLVYTQQISGEPAPPNPELETELYEGWLKAITGEDDAFLKRPLSETYGTHDPARIAYWQQRKAELTSSDPEVQAKQNRRRPFYKMATRLLRQSAPDDQGIKQDVISYIDDWFESNPGKVMTPELVKGMVEAFEGNSNGALDPVNDLTGLAKVIADAAESPRMDEHGQWWDRDGNQVNGPEQDPNVQKVVAPAIAILTPEAAVMAVGLMAGAGMISEARKEELGRAIERNFDEFQREFEKIIINNPMLLVPVIIAHMQHRQMLDPDDEGQLSKLPGFPAKPPEVSKLENIPTSIDTDTPPSEIQELQRPQIEVYPDQSDDEMLSGPLILNQDDVNAGETGRLTVSLKKSSHLPESLDWEQTREFYLGRLAKAKKINRQIKNLRLAAEDAIRIRNQERTLARSLMRDRKKAEELDRDEPNMTYGQVLAKYRKLGYEGEALLKEVRESAFRSNKEVNKSLGFK